MAKDLGFALFVPYKSNTVTPADDGSAWSQDWQIFDLLPAFFYEAYHICKLVAYNLVVSARQMRMRGIRPDFPSEVPILEDVVRGMVAAPLLRAA